MKSQKLKPIACVLLASLFLAGCNGGHSTATGSTNATNDAQIIVDNKVNQAAFIEMVRKAPAGPVNYEVINRKFYTDRKYSESDLGFNPNYNGPVSQIALQSDALTYAGWAVAGAALIFTGPVAAPLLAIAGLGMEIYSALSEEDEPNELANQVADLQSKVKTLEENLDNTQNKFFAYMQEQAQVNVSNSEAIFVRSMEEISFTPPDPIFGDSCSVDAASLWSNYGSVLGMDVHGCNPDNSKFDLMKAASDGSKLSSLNTLTNPTTFINAMANVSGAIIPGGYNGDFSRVMIATKRSQSALIGVLEDMYNQLNAAVPQQGKGGQSNIVPLIEDYNKTVSYVYLASINSLQGAYNIENMNNYLNYLNAVHAIQHGTPLTQQRGYENIAAVNFVAKPGQTVTQLTNEYANIQNNLLMLYTARFNALFNVVNKYIITDKPLGTQQYPAVPTHYTVESIEYTYQVPLKPYNEVFANLKSATKLSNLPDGSWRESAILYQSPDITAFYNCSNLSPDKISKTNCPSLFTIESGYYDGMILKVSALKAGASKPTYNQIYNNQPFTLASCENPQTARVSIASGGAGVAMCDKYKKWDVTKQFPNSEDAYDNLGNNATVTLAPNGNGHEYNPYRFDINMGPSYFGFIETVNPSDEGLVRNSEISGYSITGNSNGYVGALIDVIIPDFGNVHVPVYIANFLDGAVISSDTPDMNIRATCNSEQVYPNYTQSEAAKCNGNISTELANYLSRYNYNNAFMTFTDTSKSTNKFGVTYLSGQTGNYTTKLVMVPCSQFPDYCR